MVSQPDNVDLSLVSTVDLLTELLARADHGIVALLHDDIADCRLLRQWKGNHLTSGGLASSISDAIIQDYNEKIVPPEPHDF